MESVLGPQGLGPFASSWARWARTETEDRIRHFEGSGGGRLFRVSGPHLPAS